MKLRNNFKKTLVVVTTLAMIVTSMPQNVRAMDYDAQPLGENVALGKTVIVPREGADASAIVDGNTTKGWQDPIGMVTDRDDPQVWYIDLEDTYTIDKIKLYWEAACADVFDIYVSETNDEDAVWTQVAEVTDGDAGAQTYKFEEITARYVKLDLQHRKMDYGYNLYEAEVYTTGSVDEEAETDNLALDATATANAADGTNTADKAIDGKTNTYWQAPMANRTNDEIGSDYITLEWEEPVTFSMVRLNWGGGYPKGYKLQISEDGETWEDIYEVTDGKANELRKIQLEEPVTSKYLRLQNTVFGAYRNELWEFEVYDETKIPVTGLVTNRTEVVVVAGDEKNASKQIPVNVSPSNAGNKTLTWTSADESIATVDAEGVVTAVSAGETEVTATSVSTPDVSVSFKVYVAASIGKPEITAERGEDSTDVEIAWTAIDGAEKYELYRVTDVKAEEETSDETDVDVEEDAETEVTEITVSQKETLIYSGTELTYTDKELPADGCYYYVKAIADTTNKLLADGASDVTSLVSPTSIVLDQEQIDLHVGESAALTATVTPDIVEDKSVTWTSEDTSVAVVNENGVIRAAGEGTTKIVATTNYGNATAACEVNVEKTDIVQPLGENVAFYKPVTMPYRTADSQKIVDGKIDTSYQYNNDVPDPDNPSYDPQNWIIDFQDIYVIDTVKTTWQYSCASEYEIYVAEELVETENEDGDIIDETAWVKVADETDGKAGTATYNFAAIKARYLKLALKYRAMDNFGYCLYELEAYTIGSVGDEEGYNLATSATATASEYQAEVRRPQMAIDGDLSSYWQAPTNVFENGKETAKARNSKEKGEDYLSLEWEEPQTFDAIKIAWGEGYAKDYKLQISEDGEEWTDIVEITDGKAKENRKIKLEEPVTTRYLRMQGVTLGAYRYEIFELGVYNETLIEVSDILTNVDTLSIDLDNANRLTGSIETKVVPANAGDQSLIWTSDDENIATVDENGVVTAVKAGITTVTVTSASNPEVSKQITVYVSNAVDKTVVTAARIGKTDSIQVDWTAVENAVSYELYRVSGKTVDKVYIGEEISYTDEGLEPSVYSYYVTAIADKTSGVLSDSTSESTENVQIPIDVTGVTLNLESVELKVGDSTTLSATVEPWAATNKDVTWSLESNNGVLSVSNGKVTALKEGIGTVIVTTDDGEFTAKCVVKAVPVDATSITLNKEAETVELGTVIDLSVSVLPANTTYKAVTWTSSDENVAKVEAGRVTTVGVGQAVITATNTATPSVSATYTVDVKIAPTEITLSQTTATVYIGTPLQLVATITPDNATNTKVTWTSSDTAVATVDENGNITGLKEGTANISVTTEDGEKTATCVVKVGYAPTPAPGRGKIKKATPKKLAENKVKLTLKKVKNAKGYQVWIMTSKKAKKALVKKTTTKTTLTIKSNKLKKKKKLFAKVQAYVLDAKKKKVYGAWSKVKAIKVK